MTKKLLAAAAAAAIAVQMLPAMAFETLNYKFSEKPKPIPVEGYKKINIAEDGEMPVYEWIDAQGNEAEPQREVVLLDAASLPAQYTSPYITSVKNQDKDGCCWAFACIGAAEASINKKGYAKDPDYSEEHLAYFASNSLSQKYRDGKTGIADPYDKGGNSELVANALSVWTGVELERNYPYEPEGGSRIYPEEVRFNSYAHLKKYETYTFDEVAAVKQAIIDYGSAAYEFHTGDPTKTVEYYYNDDDSLEVDHEVLLVGWDDSVSKYKFSPVPQNDGAWLAKNSWGDEWNDDGYFWISYDNKTLKGRISIFEMDSADNYDNIYLYDGAGNAAKLDVPEYANTFTAEKNEAIRAVAGFIPGAGDVTASIYKCSGKELNFYESRFYPSITSETLHVSREGYYTIDLPLPVNVKAGETYTVVMKFSGGKACVEDKNNEAGIIYTINSGESYVKAPLENGDYEWTDVTEVEVKNEEIDPGNVSVRALTTNGFAKTDYSYDIVTLQKLIEAAQMLDKADYNSAAWSNMQSALENAEQVYEAVTDTQSAIIEYYADELHSALAALTNKTYTREMVLRTADAYEKELIGDYTPSSLSKMKAAIHEARSLTDTSYDFEIDAAMAMLVNTRINLKKAKYITNAEELQALSGQTLEEDTEAVLMNNIAFNKNTINNYRPINDFHGTFDGNGHIISGININSNEQAVGLFGFLEADTVVKNVGVYDSYFATAYDGQRFAGGIAGLCDGEIFNSYAIVGTEDSIISDGVLMYATGYITGVLNNGSMKNCYGFDLTSNMARPMGGNGQGAKVQNMYYYYPPSEYLSNMANIRYVFDENGNVVDAYPEDYYYIAPSGLAKILNLKREDGKAWFVNELEYPSMASYSSDGMYINDGVLYSYEGTDSTVTIPSEVNYIHEGAFENNPNISGYAFSGNAPYVGRRAFSNAGSHISYFDGAQGFDEAPWTYYKSMVQKAQIQYNMTSAKSGRGYAITITPVINNPDDVEFIRASYDAGGRLTGVTRAPLTGGVSVQITVDAPADAKYDRLMLLSNTNVPTAKTVKIDW